MKALQYLVEGCGTKFRDRANTRLMSLVFEALGHRNRFVRETGFHVCASLITCGAADGELLIETGIRLVFIASEPDRNK